MGRLGRIWPLAAGLFLLALCLSGSALGATYSGSAGAPGGLVPGGGGGGGPVYFYDLAHTDDNLQWPTPATIKNSLCKSVYDSPARDTAGKAKNWTAQVTACEQKVGAAVMGGSVTPQRISVLRQGNSNDECAGAKTSGATVPCLANQNRREYPYSSLGLFGVGGFRSEFISRDYDKVPPCDSPNAALPPSCVAQNVVAWTVKVWRYDPEASSPDTTPDPIFERRPGLQTSGTYADATDDGLLGAGRCPASSSLSANCIDNLQWWMGGHGYTTQNPSGASGGIWFNSKTRAGALGPTSRPEWRAVTSAPSDGTDKKIPAECAARWKAYNQSYPNAAAKRGASTSLWNWVGMSGGAGNNVCFWPLSQTWSDNGKPQKESIALGWGFRASGIGISPFRFKIEGKPGVLYAVQVTGLDEREQIVNQAFRVFFSQAPPTPTSGCPTGTSCERVTPAAPTVSPVPVLSPELTAPDSLTTGENGEVGLNVDSPQPKLEGSQATFPVRTWVSVVEPQAALPGAVGLDGDSSTRYAGQSFYEQLMKNREAGDYTSEVSYGAGSLFGTQYLRTEHAGATGATWALDVLPLRDETGQFENNADLGFENPLVERSLTLNWRIPSLSPDQVLEGARLRYRDGAIVAGALEYETAGYSQVQSDRYDAAATTARKNAEPQRICAGQAAGEWCIQKDPTVRNYALPGFSADGMRLLSSHYPASRHQLAQAYQLQQERGVFRVRLSTNRKDLVDHLDLYDRDPDARGSRKKRITAPNADGDWEFTFCRSGARDQARRFDGDWSNLYSYPDSKIGDEGCQGDYYQWVWANGDNELSECSAATPKISEPDLKRGVPSGADVGGKLPWSRDNWEPCTYEVPGYRSSGHWETQGWNFQFVTWPTTVPIRQNGVTSNSSCFRIPAGTNSYPVSPEGDPSGYTFASGKARNSHCLAVSADHRLIGYWTTPGLKFVWDGPCTDTKGVRPAPPADAIAGDVGPVRIPGFYRGNAPTAAMIQETTPSGCSPIKKIGWKHKGTWVKRAADVDYDPRRTDNRLNPGEYLASADFSSGSRNVRWRIEIDNYTRNGSSWNWSYNYSYASPSELVVSTLQPTR